VINAAVGQRYFHRDRRLLATQADSRAESRNIAGITKIDEAEQLISVNHKEIMNLKRSVALPSEWDW
jgi:hypothetical protein